VASAIANVAARTSAACGRKTNPSCAAPTGDVWSSIWYRVAHRYQNPQKTPVKCWHLARDAYQGRRAFWLLRAPVPARHRLGDAQRDGGGAPLESTSTPGAAERTERRAALALERASIE